MDSRSILEDRISEHIWNYTHCKEDTTEHCVINYLLVDLIIHHIKNVLNKCFRC